jgi:hypothetical protein
VSGPVFLRAGTLPKRKPKQPKAVCLSASTLKVTTKDHVFLAPATQQLSVDEMHYTNDKNAKVFATVFTGGE